MHFWKPGSVVGPPLCLLEYPVASSSPASHPPTSAQANPNPGCRTLGRESRTPCLHGDCATPPAHPVCSLRLAMIKNHGD